MLIDPEEEREVHRYDCRDVRMPWSLVVVVVQAELISERVGVEKRLRATTVCCRKTGRFSLDRYLGNCIECSVAASLPTFDELDRIEQSAVGLESRFPNASPLTASYPNFGSLSCAEVNWIASVLPQLSFILSRLRLRRQFDSTGLDRKLSHLT